MVHIIHGYQDTGKGSPYIQIHMVERHVHGNSVHIHVMGEMLIAAKERVFARDLKLNTIQVLLLTPETGSHTAYIVQKWIYSKGSLDNYASIDIFDYTGTEVTAGRGPSSTPSDPASGSLWLNFEALGE